MKRDTLDLETGVLDRGFQLLAEVVATPSSWVPRARYNK